MDAKCLNLFFAEQDTLALGLYWDLECAIASYECAAFSETELKDKSTRECWLCGHISNTDESGSVPKVCDNKKCAQVWIYWKISRFPCAHFINAQKNREDFLRTKIRKEFNSSKLSSIPREIVGVFLLNAMIERISIEQKH